MSIRKIFISLIDIGICLPIAFAKFGVPALTEDVKVFDTSGTELDDDVFEDVVKDPSTGVLTIKLDTGLSQLHM